MSKMSEDIQPIRIEAIHLKDLADALRQTRIFASTPFDAIAGVDQVEHVTVKAGSVLVEPNEPWLYSR